MPFITWQDKYFYGTLREIVKLIYKRNPCKPRHHLRHVIIMSFITMCLRVFNGQGHIINERFKAANVDCFHITVMLNVEGAIFVNFGNGLWTFRWCVHFLSDLGGFDNNEDFVTERVSVLNQDLFSLVDM